MHDLHEVNTRTVRPPEKVPNPQLALHKVTLKHCWFTAIDLANVFYCIPLAEESQDIFAFTWQNEHLTYTRMPQGYRSTPTIFNALVQQDLRDIPLPDNTVLVQYVDDLLLASTLLEDCMVVTRSVLLALETAAYKCKREKLHLLVPSVQFLGPTPGP